MYLAVVVSGQSRKLYGTQEVLRFNFGIEDQKFSDQYKAIVWRKSHKKAIPGGFLKNKAYKVKLCLKRYKKLGQLPVWGEQDRLEEG